MNQALPEENEGLEVIYNGGHGATKNFPPPIPAGGYS
jgi:hypothetical protein